LKKGRNSGREEVNRVKRIYFADKHQIEQEFRNRSFDSHTRSFFFFLNSLALLIQSPTVTMLVKSLFSLSVLLGAAAVSAKVVSKRAVPSTFGLYGMLLLRMASQTE
jgi:hypothetical protein